VFAPGKEVGAATPMPPPRVDNNSSGVCDAFLILT